MLQEILTDPALLQKIYDGDADSVISLLYTLFGFPHSPKTTEPISEPTDIHAAVHVLDGLNEGFAGRVAELVVEKILLGVGDQENLW